MDAVIILTFLVGVYFVYEYLKLNKKIPQRSTEPMHSVLAKKTQELETARQVQLLLNSQEFQNYQENKSRLVQSEHEKEDNFEDETDILREL